MVPHLVTALSGPLLDIEKKILDAMPAIERWLRLEWQEHTPPLYGSVDLRNSGFKLAPVDTNLFPGGFHQLSPEMGPLAVQAAMAAVEKYCPDAKDLLIVPDARLDEPEYLHNLARLMQIFRQVGLVVKLGSPDLHGHEPRRYALADGTQLAVYPLERTANGRRVGMADFDPCIVILNNDMSFGTPAVLENLAEQTILPPLHAGWSIRRKSQHFAAYDDVIKKFSKLVDIDPWMLNAYFLRSTDVDLREHVGEEALADNVSTLLSRIRKKYRHYGIKEKPFVIVKSNSGTRGMGVISIRDAAQIRDLNLHQRADMTETRDGREIHDILIQEGVQTVEQISDTVAEPVVYSIDRYVIGSYYRVQEQLGNRDNLNTPAAHFVPLAFAQQHGLAEHLAVPNRFYMYGVVARLALLAASIEMERTDPDVQPV